MAPQIVPQVQLLEKTLFRGRGGKRVRAIIAVTFTGGEGGHPGGYTEGLGFYGDPAKPNDGIDLQSVLPEGILKAKVGMVEPRFHQVSEFGFDLEDTFCLLDFDELVISNYVTPGPTAPFKKLFVKAYGVKAGPTLVEPSSVEDLAEGTFLIEIEYTPVSGGEA
jgi:hypothetical protein